MDVCMYVCLYVCRENIFFFFLINHRVWLSICLLGRPVCLFFLLRLVGLVDCGATATTLHCCFFFIFACIPSLSFLYLPISG